MSKIKMRCIACGKWFQSANAKEVTCPDCMQKARKEKMATKNAPPIVNKPATGPVGQGFSNQTRPGIPPRAKPTQSGTSHWLDTLNDVKVGQPDQLQRPKIPSSPARDNRSIQGGHGGFRGADNYRDDRGAGSYREGGNRGPGGYRDRRYEQRSSGGYRVGGGAGLPETIGPRPRQPMDGGFDRGSRQDRPRHGGSREGSPSRPKPNPKPKVSPPRPKREKTPPPPPFIPTSEQIAQVESRYLELLAPNEFDGIRTQIAQELGIPKKAVKKIIKDLRDRQNIPSWWELQTYKGDIEELERIKAAYEPLLPVPPVGVHKKIAEELGIKPAVVYQAIKLIRLEMNLPQFNDPILHEQELAQQTQKQHSPTEEQEVPQALPASSASETTDQVASSTVASEPKSNITEA